MPGSDREYEKDRKLFVGGLDYETTDNELRDYFEQFGELTDYVVMKFPDTKRSRGFGFVTFKDPGNLEDCVVSGPHQLGSTTVELKRATPREDDRKGGRSGGRFFTYSPASPPIQSDVVSRSTGQTNQRFSRGRPDDHYTDEGEPICRRCSQPGHIELGCRVIMDHSRTLNDSRPTSGARR